MTQDAEIPLTKREFERALAELTRAHGASSENPGSYRSEECVRCYGCMFTTGSVECFKCTYCSDCTRCSDCTHCARCDGCHNSSYLRDSTNCLKSSYLTMSRDCYECVFCFGCAGLVGKEFHILNRPFPRKTYFKMVAELEVAFGLKTAK